MFNVAVLANPPGEPTWYPHWPFSTDTGIDEVHIGYGDWCTLAEGPHPGIDFGDPNGGGTMVYSPCADDYSVQFKGCMQGSNGWLVVVAKPEDDWGWSLGHLLVDDPAKYNPPNDTLLQAFTEVVPTYPIDWPHVHLMWLEAWPTPSSYNSTGYYNPFKWMAQDPDLRTDLIGYDAVCFGSPGYIKWQTSMPQNGIFFSPDEAEHPTQFDITAMTWIDFQEIVFGKVDVSVRPYSAFQGLFANDTCGVNTIGYKILWQNPYTCEYEDIDETSIEGEIFNGCYRLLVSMNDGEMIEGDTPEYRAVFLDGNVIGSGDPQMWNGFNTSYIVTNSGIESMGSSTDAFNSGWNNVFTDPYDRQADWDDKEYLRGAWDTRLRIESAAPAQYSAQAIFPDGRYAFDIKALSQATAFLAEEHQEWGQQTMPCEDPVLPSSPVTGVVVDNFRPFVDSVFVYSMMPEPRIYFEAGWELTSQHTAIYNNTINGYCPHGHPNYIQDLWVAVRYSEPMNVSPYDIWITAEKGGEEQWNSMEDWGYFRPEPVLGNWIKGEPDQNQHSGGTWVLYRLAPIGTPLPEYKGKLTLHISHSGTLTDLAGNSIDGDPSTIAYPRGETTGQWNNDNYDAEDDASYTWGEPSWEIVERNETTFFEAQVGADNDVVFSIWVGDINSDWLPWWDNQNQTQLNVNDLSLNNDGLLDEPLWWAMKYFLVPCPYYYGCWAMNSIICGNSTMSVCYEMHVAVIRPQEDNPVVIHSYIHGAGHWLNYFHVMFNSFENSEAKWIFASPENETYENRYFWFRDRFGWGRLSQPESGCSLEYWKCVDSFTGTFMSTTLSEEAGFPELCDSWYDEIEDEVYYINYNYDSMEEYLQSDGNMHIPAYYVFYDDPQPVFRGNVLIGSPARDYQRTQLRQNTISSLSDTVSAGESIFILPNANPIRGEITLSVFNCMGENYEVHLYDLSGREVAMQSGIMFADNEQLHLGTTHIPEGLYFISVTIGDCRLNQKVTVLR